MRVFVSSSEFNGTLVFLAVIKRIVSFVATSLFDF
jgi:hypothetical protein